MRAALIGVGAALVQNFSSVRYLFDAYLVITGIKMCLAAEHVPSCST